MIAVGTLLIVHLYNTPPPDLLFPILPSVAAMIAYLAVVLEVHLALVG